MLLLLQLLLAPSRGGRVDPTGGLRADPIEGSALQYLDGPDWTASAPAGQTIYDGCLPVQPGVDFGEPGRKRNNSAFQASSPEGCCQICGDMPGCIAGVFVGQGFEDPGSCFLKDAEDMKHPKNASKPDPAGKGTSACTPRRTTTAGGLSIRAHVPGDLISDLARAGLVGDPIFEQNFLNGTATWNLPRWDFTRTFALEPALRAAIEAGHSTVLVLDGVKMGATIKLNGHVLGRATDQFLRYEFALPAAAFGQAVHLLEVSFDRDIDCGGRWMACTGGWDWAPYTYTTQGGALTFTKGLWKSVYLTTVGTAAISHLVPHVFYQGEYPTSPLQPGKHADFEVRATVHLRANSAGSASVSVQGGWAATATATTTVALTPGANAVTLVLTATAAQVQLWWPNGMGKQPLYTISATCGAAMAQRTIGFRFVALVTGNDTSPSYVAAAKGQQGTEHLGMLFRVNGAALFARGANMIPMEELEGRLDAQAHRVLVQSAAAARFNIFRFWGGGMFLPDAWYDECDKAGIMVYHDMQYAQNGHSPQQNAAEEAELRYQIRRLSAHPSIVMWDGCNECQVLLDTPTGIYASFVMRVVAEEDSSRALWPSCPARGWSKGVDRLTARPVCRGEAGTAGRCDALVPHPLSAPQLEKHGPYQHGDGLAAVDNKYSRVDGGTFLSPQQCDPKIPPRHPDDPPCSRFGHPDSKLPIQLTQNATGLTLPSVFGSEFGCVGMSSFESMSATLKPEHWGLHAGMPGDDSCSYHECRGENPMSKRNYPCDNLISYYFDLDKAKPGEVGECAFKRQLWMCMMSQALELKGDIETRRSTNTYGVIVWQFNEIWPTGGWGTIEYGSKVPGQVLGGRWKPAQYWYKKSIYADVMASCGTSTGVGSRGACYVKNDGHLPFVGTLNITSISFKTGAETVLRTQQLTLAAGPGVSEWLEIAMPIEFGAVTEILRATVTAADGTLMSDNVIPLTTPANMAVSNAKVELAIASAPNTDGSVDIGVSADHVAVFVTLTTRADGRFSDNAFLLLPSTGATVQFVPFGPLDLDLLKSSLRVEHLASYT